MEKLALTSTEVNGKMKNVDGSELTIKPLLICYDIERITDVIPIFSDQIKKLIDQELIIQSDENNYQAIGWRKHHDDMHKICISDYWPNFKISEKSSKIDYGTLEDYLKFIKKNSQTLGATRKSILNAFNKILYIEGIRDENSRVFTISKLIEYFKELEVCEYDKFKLNLYNWSLALENGSIDFVTEEIKTYIPHFLDCFSRQLNYSKDFINESSINEEVVGPDENAQFFEKNEIRVNVSTVHAVKGQTHTATLYLETFFSQGAGNYESERLQNQILGTPIKEHLDNYSGGSVDKIIQSARMAYVGFSRPTHFLCFAVESSRANKMFNEIDRNDWDVLQVKKTGGPDI